MGPPCRACWQAPEPGQPPGVLRHPNTPSGPGRTGRLRGCSKKGGSPRAPRDAVIGAHKGGTRAFMRFTKVVKLRPD